MTSHANSKPEAMLGRAVQDHHPGLPGLKGTTLSQHYQANAKANTLKPVPAAALNSKLPAWSQSSNPLKRPASQINSQESLYSSQERNSKKTNMDGSNIISEGGRVGMLHQSVFFDENDFEEDVDLDLDEETPPSMKKEPSSTQPSTTSDPQIFKSESPRTVVADSSPRKATMTRTPVSSTPLPWSSSPSSHHNLPPPTAKIPLDDRPIGNVTKRRTLPWLDEQRQLEELRQEEESRRAKLDRDLERMTGGYSTQDKARIGKTMERRKAREADWSYEDLAGVESRRKVRKSNNDDSDLDGKNIPDYVKEKIMVARNNKKSPTYVPRPKGTGDLEEKNIPDFVKEKIVAARNKNSALFTPLPKNKGDSKFPWNTTASAIKDQQKQLRQGHKKLVKDHEGDEVAKTKGKKKRGPLEKVFLSDEQRSVLDLVSAKEKSVFFTGSAGTGKSVLLREIINSLRIKWKREPDRVAVTASTGLAACNVGGVTLHSFAGIGLGKEAVPELVRKIKRNQKAKLRWMRTKVLIVDEISMVDGDLFDKLENIARAIRNNGRPFGGIQLVITGDFFQLPPVPDYGRISKFSFDAATWNTSIEHTIGLTQVFRQKDPGAFPFLRPSTLLIATVFANMLNEMRLGKLTPKSINTFRQLNRPLSFGDNFEATEL